MRLQNIILPSTDTCTEESMYFRREGEVYYAWCTDWIDIHAGGIVSFDTYFNGFSAEKWMKYTQVRAVTLTLRIRGYVRLTLTRKEKRGDDILTEYVGEYLCVTQNNEIKEFAFPVNTVFQSGMYCFTLTGVEGVSTFYGGGYDADPPPRTVRPVKIGIAICTFKREKFLERNLRVLNERFLKKPDSPLFDNLEIFVSDNAKTLDAASLSDDKIHIFPNRNVGGAGGFTRCMIEIRKAHMDITHILLMDDDVILEPECVFRTWAILSCIKEEYRDAFLGGAMLRLDMRYLQTESGAVWNSGYLVSLKNGLDLRTLDACLFNEFEERTQFNAWWYCAFPAEVVTPENLPMPIFIRGDDVEYGLRNMKRLILINGICVWHEPFEYKYSSYLYYYILRNRLIDNALHGMVLPKQEFQRILRVQVMDELRLYRYKNADLLMRGVEDFLRGAAWLGEQDGEALHKDIMAGGYQLRYLEDLEESVQFFYPMYEQSLKATPAVSFFERLVRHFTVNGTFLKPKKDFVIIPTIGAQQSSVYRADTVLNYDYSSRKGFLSKRNPEKCRECLKRLKALNRRISLEYDSASSRFAAEALQLESLSFWTDYLGLDVHSADALPV